MRSWQQPGFASPPLAIIAPNSRPLSPLPRAMSPAMKQPRPLSPSTKPALRGQRDHSACNKQETPLKVRKTRENLRKDIVIGDVPPPCLACANPGVKLATAHSCMSLNSASLDGLKSETAASSLRTISPEPLAMPEPAPQAPQMDPPKMHRHKSVSKRVLSSLKSNLSNATSRTKSSHSIRPMESETSLLRKMSSRGKADANMATDRRAYSFDVSRESVASEVEVDVGGRTDPGTYGAHTTAHRSFTDSTVSTSALVEELEAKLPPGTPTPGRVVLTHRHSALSPTPPPKHPANFELTPRPNDRRLPPEPATSMVQAAAIPFIELNVAVDTPILDIHEKSDVWIALEASVQTQIVDLPITVS